MDALQKRLLSLPLLVILMGIGAAAMFVPGFYAAATEQYADMRAFFYTGSLLLCFTGLVGVATANYRPVHPGRSHLFALVGAFVFLPVFLAIPITLIEPDARFLNAYAEMVSCITTTGASFFDGTDRLTAPIHLWRATVAWLGGFFMLVTAGAVLAPMNLGGFDVLSVSDSSGRRSSLTTSEAWSVEGGRRLMLFSTRFFPLYLGLTLLLWFLLFIRSDAPLFSLVHAMSVLSTSGITATPGGLPGSGIGIGGEITIFGFLLLSLTRLPFTLDRTAAHRGRVWSDPELRMGLAFVLIVPILLFVRHWIGALEVNATDSLELAARAMWGSMFTVMSFLTTTGFESVAWQDARSWSGLATPGIILLGLSLIGGGVATTAGGVKLLRVYALYTHGMREMDRLIHPSAVDGSGNVTRRLRREGAYLAWVFFMLFALSLTAIVLALSVTGIQLDVAMTLAVAALSTSGPVAQVTLTDPISYNALSDGAKWIVSAAMVLGRLETLVIIALFNPDFWRR